ncbi:transposase [Candidatus Tisiphia endosymbiont of Dioctria rufipes]|uniref:transposase n=1 Tax=Candidatus Tisiphia endosymbiont of Dioctria rufipes TaxID=3066255 RepID=UPI003977DECC
MNYVNQFRKRSIIATNDNPYQALDIYKRRWEIENLFACLKTRGFNFENTHLTLIRDKVRENS